MRESGDGGLVDDLETASDNAIYGMIQECQTKINNAERQLKYIKQCKQLMQYSMDRKMNDQEAVNILIDLFKARLLESL